MLPPYLTKADHNVLSANIDSTPARTNLDYSRVHTPIHHSEILPRDQGHRASRPSFSPIAATASRNWFLPNNGFPLLKNASDDCEDLQNPLQSQFGIRVSRICRNRLTIKWLQLIAIVLPHFIYETALSRFRDRGKPLGDTHLVE